MWVHRFEDHGEYVPEAPAIADREVLKRRLAPLHEDVRDLSRRDRCTIHRPDDDGMRAGVVHRFLLVSENPLVDAPELVPKLTNGMGGHMPEVTLGEPGMLVAVFSLPAKGIG